ncbi:hypothetical protein H0H93_013095 [Arthromyces matolae]|nr:hypothetical protein H0H93_013095 [Arthromyces matolae]
MTGSFSREPSGDNTFLYNVPVYANASLIHDNHTLTIQNGHVGGPKSLVLLDYIVYSYDDGLNPSLTAPDSTFVASATATSSSSDSPMASAGQGHSFQRNSKTLGISNPFNTPSKPRNLTSILKIQSWWRNSATMSRNRMSFNPSLLAEPVVMNNKHASANTANVRRPPPVTTIQPLHLSALRHDSLQPLQPNRDTTPTPPPLDARNEPSQPLSIVEWQRRTQREADDIPPRLDVSDVEMSSYYDFSSDAPEQPPPHVQPRATTRRFTVVNV